MFVLPLEVLVGVIDNETGMSERHGMAQFNVASASGTASLTGLALYLKHRNEMRVVA